MTPTGPRDIARVLSTLARSHLIDRTIQTVITKTGKALDRSNFNYADTQRQLHLLQRRFNEIKAKSKKKQPVNPNKLFISLDDIQNGLSRVAA